MEPQSRTEIPQERHLQLLLSDASSNRLSSPPAGLTSLDDFIIDRDELGESYNEMEDNDIDMFEVDDPDGQSMFRIQQRLENFAEYLRQSRWSFKQLIYAWITHSSEIQHRRYRTREQRRRAWKETLEGIPQVVDHYDLASIAKAELNKLVKQPYFGKFDHTIPLEDIDFDAAFNTVQNTAPRLHTFLYDLLRNHRAHRTSYASQRGEKSLQQRLFTVVSIICHSRYAKQSNYLSSILDAYLIGSGVKRRVIETLSGLGLCHSYVQGNRLMKQIADHEKSRLPNLGKNPQSIIVYDNMNFKETIRDEILGHKATMRAVTTAAIILCPDIPASGLSQDMHNPTVPLDFYEIIDSPAIYGNDNGIGKQISIFLISNVIAKMHSSSFKSIFKSANSAIPSMPELDRLTPNRTQFWQFGAIFEDEGTIAGTYGVHDNIFLRQLHLHASQEPGKPDDFNSRLWLVHGDQLTAERIRAVQNEQLRAELPYDRRQWLLGVPAWFHIQLNLLNTIVRTHFAPTKSGQEAYHCIESDISVWGRSQINPNSPKYHQLEPIVSQSFATRVLALFYCSMQRRGYLTTTNDNSLERRQEYDRVIGTLATADYLQLVEDVRLMAFTLDAWEGIDPYTREPVQDIGFRSMCRLLQEIELFLTVRHAVKHGDIGLLRYLVDPLIIYFFGASQHNYGNEMLYYRWNLSSVNNPELQRAILASGLVNWQGKPAHFKAIDLGLEHLNANCKIEMKAYRNSTHNTDISFDRVCLTNTWIRGLREKLESTFGQYMPDSHTTASTLDEIFLLARNLLIGNLAEPRDPEYLPDSSALFDSEDILRIGMERLAEKVDQFNNSYIYHTETIANIQSTDEDGIERNIRDYATIIDERYDGILVDDMASSI